MSGEKKALIPQTPKSLRELISSNAAENGLYPAPTAFWITAALRATYFLGFAAAETAATVTLLTVARTTYAMAGAALFCCAVSMFIQTKWRERNENEKTPNADVIFGAVALNIMTLLGITGAAIAYTGASHLPFDAAASTAKEAIRIVMTAIGAGISLPALLALSFCTPPKADAPSRGAVFLNYLIITAFTAAATTAMFDLMPNFIAMIAASTTLSAAGQTALKVVTYVAQPVVEGLASAALSYVGSVFYTTGSYALGKLSEAPSCCARPQYEQVP